MYAAFCSEANDAPEIAAIDREAALEDRK